MRIHLSWSSHRTQIVVAVVAIAATLLVFRVGASIPISLPAVSRSHGAGAPAPPGLGMAFAPGLGVLASGSVRPRAGAAPTVSATPAVGNPIDPHMFAQGACVVFSPLQSDRHLTIFLDAGHGGKDPGGNGVTPSGRTITEAWVNLRVEMDAMTLLTQRGYRVVVSRTGPGDVHPVGPGDLEGGALVPRAVRADIAARDICANMGGANLLVGIFMNAGYWGVGGSVTVYCDVRPFAAANRRFAHLLQHDVLAALNAHKYGIPNDGVLADDQMGSSSSAAAESYGHLMLLGPAKRGYFSTPSQMPGALIEPLFLTDPYEASVASTARGQNLMAAGVAQAIDDYFAS